MRRLIASLCLLAVPISAHAASGDPRGLTDAATDVTAGRQAAARNPAAVDSLRTSLGADAVVSVDDRTGALRMVGRLDGFLTPASTADPAAIALSYVRAHRAAFGLTAADVDSLVLVRRVTSGSGLQRLFWQQRVDGVPALDSGLRANLTADGRLINIEGSPVSGLQSVRVTPRLTAGEARVAALGGVGAAARPSLARPRADARSTTTFASGDRAALGVFTGAGSRLAWDTTVTVDSAHRYRVVVDAATGRTLLRRNLVQHATANIHRNYPGATHGGTQESLVTFPAGWIAPGASTLTGPNVHAFADIFDNDLPDVGEEIAPTAPNVWNFPLVTNQASFLATDPARPVGACSAAFVCTWDPSDLTTAAATATQNKGQNVAQVFYFVNTFHDWLHAAPFSFTAANGAFEVSDPVSANALDGADTADSAHIDNANMSTPPDGQSPTMQMYLAHLPGAPWGEDSLAGEDPFLPANGGDDAGLVYHEYTHGLSNRLVVDSLGNSTINSQQAASMGEAWSDWYAFDYLADPASCEVGAVQQACQPDSIASGELVLSSYLSVGIADSAAFRTQAIDCAVGAAVAGTCDSPAPGVPAGGYTYASFGKIIGFPEVHADGEIWAQTLWDLRRTVGVALARSLVTRAMELSPDDPSFLDMRNAILQADTAFNAGAARDQIWAVFAGRGMGYFAGTLDSGDTAPVANFSLPPAANAPKGTVSGTVIDTDTHAPVVGTRVAFAGLDSGFPGGGGATTTATGAYALPALPIGSYPYLVAGGAGYEPAMVKPFNLAAGAQTSNLLPRRGWALASGGGRVTAFTGGDNTAFGCGPSGLIDGKLGSGWGSDLVGGPPTITVQLPVSVTVKSFGIDPGATCGDPSDASTQQFQVETSPDGLTYTVAAAGVFTLAAGGRLNEVTPTAGAANVRFVRLTAVSNFGNANAFVDISEFSVHGFQPGVATSVITGPATIQLGATTVFTSAASAGVAGSPIAARKWSVAGIPPSAAVTYGLKGAKLNQKLTMTLAVTDFAGRTGSSSKTVTVVDTLGPVVTIKKVSGKVNKNVTISAKLVDPSGLARTVAVKFGDGKRATVKIKNGKFSVKHKYKKAKTFTITVTAKDKLKRVSRTTIKVVIKKQ